jgi:hypothetical protein
MRNSVIVTLALLAAYALGTLHGPARADDSGQLLSLMRDLINVQKEQKDALRTIAHANERCSKER